MGMILHFLLKVCLKVTKFLIKKIRCSNNNRPQLDANRNHILAIAFEEILERLQQQKTTSQELVLSNYEVNSRCSTLLWNSLNTQILADTLRADIPMISAPLQSFRETALVQSNSRRGLDVMQAIDNLECITEKPKIDTEFEKKKSTNSTRSAMIEIGAEIAGSILLPKLIDHIANKNKIKYEKLINSDLIHNNLPKIMNVKTDGKSRFMKIANKMDKLGIKKHVIDLALKKL